MLFSAHLISNSNREPDYMEQGRIVPGRVDSSPGLINSLLGTRPCGA
jgi:hypothetical protein